MKSLFLVLAAFLSLAILIPSVALAERPWQNPVIKAAGEVVSLPDAAVQPDPKIKYKVVFDITKGEPAQGKVIPGLAKVARMINVFDTAGVPPKKLKLVLVMHGAATEAALKPDAYMKKHGFPNPSLELLDQLSKAGVRLLVCGQGLKEHSIAHKDVDPKITIALSALTVLPTYQLRGYAFLPF